jgi:hypothetical protein
MKKKLTLGLIALAVAFMSTAAVADPVSYSTAGTFGCNVMPAAQCFTPTANSVVFSNAIGATFTLTFLGASGNINSPSTISLGTIQVGATHFGASLGGQHIDFTLTINQTVPSSGSDTLSAVVKGSLSQDQSSGTLTFTLGDIPAIINGVQYRPSNLQWDLIPSFDDSGTGTGQTTIQGFVTTPEPASLALLGSGMLMGGNLVRRKLKR